MDSYREIDSIFQEAVAIENAAERSAFLQAACAGEALKRMEIEKLLTAHDQAGRFMKDTSDSPPTVEPPRRSANEGQQIGAYRLLQQIGEGGFGLVYMAEQQKPVRRKVAIKIIKPGMDSKDVIARFEAERQALAMMDHPNIAKVLDAGTTKFGGPYFVMELVKGVPLTQFCQENSLPTHQRLTLFAQVCRAVHHAHQKGVIHRDIKPSNIMITLHDGKPTPKVIDFGVSKALNQQLTERTLFTRYGQMVGTPQYMSPEQAEMSGLDVDTRSDVYSLGVLLYELLTGTTPLDAERLRSSGFAEMQRLIREEEAVRPSTRLSSMGKMLATVAEQHKTEPSRLRQFVHGELDWITMKAVEKERDRRYDSASSLADDVERFLNDDTVEACPPSATYRLRKLARRHKGPVLTASVIFLALLLGMAATWKGRRDAEEAKRIAVEAKDIAEVERQKAELERQDANEAREALRVKSYTADWQLAQSAYDSNNVDESMRLLRQHEEDTDLHGFEWYYLWNQCLQHRPVKNISSNNVVWSVGFAPDRRTLVYGEADGDVVFHDLISGVDDTPPSPHELHVLSISFSPDKEHMVTASWDGTVWLWDLENREPLYQIDEFTQWAYTTAYASDGRLAVGSFDGKVKIYELGENQATVLRTWKDEKVTGLVHAVAFSEDGRYLVSAGDDYEIRVWDTRDPEADAPISRLQGHANWVFGMAFSHHGELLASGGRDRSIILWDTNDPDPTKWKIKEQIQAHENTVFSLDFDADDAYLVSGSTDNAVKVWDVATAKEMVSFRGHVADVYAVRFDPDGYQVASAGLDKTVKTWDIHAERDKNILRDLEDYGTSVAYSRSGDMLAAGSFDETVRIWNPRTGELIKSLPKHGEATYDIAFSPDGKRLASGVHDGNVVIWDTSNWQRVGEPFQAHTISTFAVSYSDKYLATAGKGEHPLKLWDAKTLELVQQLDGHEVRGLYIEGVAFSPDGKYLVSGGVDGRMIVWSTETFDIAYTWQHPDEVKAVEFSPNGRWLASGDHEGNVRLWDLENLNRGPIRELAKEKHTGWVWSLSFSPDNELGKETLAIASSDDTIKLVDVETLEERISLRGHDGWVLAVAYSPDGRTIASTSDDTTVRLWRAASDEDLRQAIDGVLESK